MSRKSPRRHAQAQAQSEAQSAAPPPYSPPSFAASIWLSPSGAVTLGFPPSPGHSGGHTVTLASSDETLLGRLLLRVLRERAKQPQAKLGQKAAPTQAMLEKLAKESTLRPFREEVRLEDFDF
jgi:hypothetical protein